MAIQKLTIWTNIKYPPDATELLRRGVAPHELVFAQKTDDSNLAAADVDAGLAMADIAFGQPEPSQLLTVGKMRWVHLNSAGYTRYDRDDLRDAFKSRSAMLTNSSSIYANPCAQHVLAMMMAVSRQLPQSLDPQRADHSWQWRKLRFETRTLTAQTVLIVGFGAIGRRLAELLAPFGANILATRRTPRGDEPIKVYPQSEIERLLPQADHVVNILPSLEENEAYFDAARLGLMKRGAALYNIGRGSTVDAQALRTCLETGRLAAAYLDVTTPEPLPADDVLWVTPNCFITPHIAGGQQDEFGVLVRHFLSNLQRFTASQPLLDRVI